jgi:hypothetical protein
MLVFGWCRVLGGGLIVMGVVAVDDAERSSPLPYPFPGDDGISSASSSLIAFRLLVIAPRFASKFAPCSCSISSSHLTLRDEEGRSAGSARFRQSFVRSLRDTQML